MKNWITCKCGRQLPAEEMKKHCLNGICLHELNRSVKGSPKNRIITGRELANRAEG